MDSHGYSAPGPRTWFGRAAWSRENTELVMIAAALTILPHLFGALIWSRPGRSSGVGTLPTGSLTVGPEGLLNHTRRTRPEIPSRGVCRPRELQHLPIHLDPVVALGERPGPPHHQGFRFLGGTDPLGGDPTGQLVFPVGRTTTYQYRRDIDDHTRHITAHLLYLIPLEFETPR